VGAEYRLLLVPLGLTLATNLLPGTDMEFDRQAIFTGEWWRLWTGQFAHWSILHLAGNLAALAGLCIIGGRALWCWITLLPVAAPLLSGLLLAAAPRLMHYRGLSGLLAFLLVGTAIEGGTAGRMLAVAYVLKLAWDASTGGNSPFLPEGIITAWPAHLGGLLLGFLAAPVIARCTSSPRTPQSSPGDSP
jgi:rhomboid family GlyGly-CTERM serine protease